LGGSSAEQFLTTAVWRITTPMGAGAIHSICTAVAQAQRRWRHFGISHMKLIGAQIIRRGGVRGPLQEPGKMFDRSNMRLLGFVTHTVDAHVFDHPLT